MNQKRSLKNKRKGLTIREEPTIKLQLYAKKEQNVKEKNQETGGIKKKGP